MIMIHLRVWSYWVEGVRRLIKCDRLVLWHIDVKSCWLQIVNIGDVVDICRES